MSEQEKYIRTSVNNYRLKNILGMMRGLIMMFIGAIGIALSLSGAIFSGATTQGSLMKTLGPEGAKIGGAAIFVVLFLIGCTWVLVRIWDLRVGLKAYKQLLQEGVAVDY